MIETDVEKKIIQAKIILHQKCRKRKPILVQLEIVHMSTLFTLYMHRLSLKQKVFSLQSYWKAVEYSFYFPVIVSLYLNK